jgi:hypothetical protein
MRGTEGLAVVRMQRYAHNTGLAVPAVRVWNLTCADADAAVTEKDMYVQPGSLGSCIYFSLIS